MNDESQKWESIAALPRYVYRIPALPARATTTTATVASASAARASPARTAIATAITPRRTAAFAVEVRLVGRFVSAFERHWNRGSLAAFGTLRRSFSAAHLGALFFQDRFARQLDAVAFDRQHLHQD